MTDVRSTYTYGMKFLDADRHHHDVGRVRITHAHDGGRSGHDHDDDLATMFQPLRRELAEAIAPLIAFRDKHLDVEEMGAADHPLLYEAAMSIDAAFDDIDAALRTLENPED